MTLMNVSTNDIVSTLQQALAHTRASLANPRAEMQTATQPKAAMADGLQTLRVVVRNVLGNTQACSSAMVPLIKDGCGLGERVVGRIKLDGLGAWAIQRPNLFSERAILAIGTTVIGIPCSL